MFLAGWWLTGIFFGWIIWAAYGDLRRLRMVRFSQANFSSSARPGLVLCISILAWAVVAAFAIASDRAALLQWLLVFKSMFLGVRAQALLLGLACGAVFQNFRATLSSSLSRLGNAIIGDKDNTAWALQSALAVGLIAAGIFAIRPDFLLYLRSLKLGTIEATFADQGPLPLRDARLNLREFREQQAVDQYRNFKNDFLSRSEARGLARRLGDKPAKDNPKLEQETGEITALLFDHYISPVLSSLLCLTKSHALKFAVQDPNLSAYTAQWQSFLLQVHRDKDLQLTSEKLTSLFDRLRNRSEAIVDRAAEFNPSCKSPKANLPEPSLTSSKDDGDEVLKHYEAVVELLKADHDNKPEIVSLVAFEPYLTSVVSDLVSLISGDREKTDFLLNMLDGFPLSDDRVTPGIINLYYQATDSWLNSIGSLPLDLVRAQIEYATHGADLMRARSEKRLLALESGFSARSGTVVGISDATKLVEVYDIFLRNAFATLTAEIDVYVQRVLSGETVPEGHRQSWIKATSRLLAMLRTKLSVPMINIDSLPSVELDSRTKERLMVASIDADFILQADLAIALSSILLKDSRASSQACNTALFFTNEASEAVQLTKKENELDEAQVQRLRQLIGAVAGRVGDACSWTDRRS